jgi:hypothetical protein
MPRSNEERRRRRVLRWRGALPELRKPGWLADLLIEAGCGGYCTRWICTTCGSGKFREALAEGLEALLGRRFEYSPNICHLRLDDDATQVLVDELLILDPVRRQDDSRAVREFESPLPGLGLGRCEARIVHDDRFNPSSWSSALSLVVDIAQQGAWSSTRLAEALEGSVCSEVWRVVGRAAGEPYDARREAAAKRLSDLYAARAEELGRERPLDSSPRRRARASDDDRTPGLFPDV